MRILEAMALGMAPAGSPQRKSSQTVAIQTPNADSDSPPSAETSHIGHTIHQHASSAAFEVEANHTAARSPVRPANIASHAKPRRTPFLKRDLALKHEKENQRMFRVLLKVATRKQAKIPQPPLFQNARVAKRKAFTEESKRLSRALRLKCGQAKVSVPRANPEAIARKFPNSAEGVRARVALAHAKPRFRAKSSLISIPFYEVARTVVHSRRRLVKKLKSAVRSRHRLTMLPEDIGYWSKANVFFTLSVNTSKGEVSQTAVPAPALLMAPSLHEESSDSSGAEASEEIPLLTIRPAVPPPPVPPAARSPSPRMDLEGLDQLKAQPSQLSPQLANSPRRRSSLLEEVDLSQSNSSNAPNSWKMQLPQAPWLSRKIVKERTKLRSLHSKDGESEDESMPSDVDELDELEPENPSTLNSLCQHWPGKSHGAHEPELLPPEIDDGSKHILTTPKGLASDNMRRVNSHATTLRPFRSAAFFDPRSKRPLDETQTSGMGVGAGALAANAMTAAARRQASVAEWRKMWEEAHGNPDLDPLAELARIRLDREQAHSSAASNAADEAERRHALLAQANHEMKAARLTELKGLRAIEAQGRKIHTRPPSSRQRPLSAVMNSSNHLHSEAGPGTHAKMRAVRPLSAQPHVGPHDENTPLEQFRRRIALTRHQLPSRAIVSSTLSPQLITEPIAAELGLEPIRTTSKGQARPLSAATHADALRSAFMATSTRPSSAAPAYFHQTPQTGATSATQLRYEAQHKAHADPNIQAILSKVAVASQGLLTHKEAEASQSFEPEESSGLDPKTLAALIAKRTFEKVPAGLISERARSILQSGTVHPQALSGALLRDAKPFLHERARQQQQLSLRRPERSPSPRGKSRVSDANARAPILSVSPPPSELPATTDQLLIQLEKAIQRHRELEQREKDRRASTVESRDHMQGGVESLPTVPASHAVHHLPPLFDTHLGITADGQLVNIELTKPQLAKAKRYRQTISRVAASNPVARIGYELQDYQLPRLHRDEATDALLEVVGDPSTGKSRSQPSTTSSQQKSDSDGEPHSQDGRVSKMSMEDIDRILAKAKEVLGPDEFDEPDDTYLMNLNLEVEGDLDQLEQGYLDQEELDYSDLQEFPDLI